MRLGFCILALSFGLSGCASFHALGPVAERQSVGVSGRFSLSASFLQEVSLGRFEWRASTEMPAEYRSARADLSFMVYPDQPASHPSALPWREEIFIQDPWGQTLGVFQRDLQTARLPKDWRLLDSNGRFVRADQANEWARRSGLPDDSLMIFKALLGQIGPRLSALLQQPIPKEISAFSLEYSEGHDWIRLRLLPDPPDRAESQTTTFSK